jgi:hypothetical protein
LEGRIGEPGGYERRRRGISSEKFAIYFCRGREGGIVRAGKARREELRGDYVIVQNADRRPPEPVAAAKKRLIAHGAMSAASPEDIRCAGQFRNRFMNAKKQSINQAAPPVSDILGPCNV